MRDGQDVRGGEEQADGVSGFDRTDALADGLDADADYDVLEDTRDSVFEDAMRSIAFSGEGKP